MRKALFLYLLLFSISFATLSGLSLTGSIGASGSADMIIKAQFQDSENENVFLNISGSLDEVVVKDRSGLILEHTLRGDGNNTVIYVTVPVDYLEFDIHSDSFTTKTEALWDFGFMLGSSENISSFNASIGLPKGSALKSTNGAVQSSSEALIVSWKSGAIDTLHKAHLKAGYELPSEQSQDYSLLIIGIGGAALGIIILAAYLYLRSRKSLVSAAADTKTEPKQEKASPLESNSVFRTLDETDKEIVREIHSQGGKTTQAHLYLHTHIPKATLSRRLASLENKGIILRSQKGNRNLITLTDVLVK